MREDVPTKARRYVVEARLVVTSVHGRTITARCRGDGQTYDLGHDDRRRWWCTCEARGRCSHVTALALVVDL